METDLQKRFPVGRKVEFIKKERKWYGRVFVVCGYEYYQGWRVTCDEKELTSDPDFSFAPEEICLLISEKAQILLDLMRWF